MVTSASMQTPRSRTADCGRTAELLTRTCLVGIQCRRRAEEHQSTSVPNVVGLGLPLTVTIRVSRVSTMVSVRVSVN